jgi:hypothetical protein
MNRFQTHFKQTFKMDKMQPTANEMRHRRCTHTHTHTRERGMSSEFSKSGPMEERRSRKPSHKTKEKKK